MENYVNFQEIKQLAEQDKKDKYTAFYALNKYLFSSYHVQNY